MNHLRGASRVAARRAQLTAGAPQSRSFFNVPLPAALRSNPNGIYTTKYNIVRPAREGTDWDDFLLALPEKDQLASTSKDIPLFVRYLKIVTDSEGRQDDFKAFVERVKNGLQVESDVFLTTDELLAVMWKNGYSEKERNALQFVFPNDYKFHYPELAAMFNLAEEDCYKFCMRARVNASHIGEVITNKGGSDAGHGFWSGGVIRDHWLLFGIGAFIFKTFPFFNYYFVFKGFGTAMWGYTMWALGSRSIGHQIAQAEHAVQETVRKETEEGQDKIMEAMQRFGNDSKCLDSLKNLQVDVAATMAEYRQALLEKERDEVISKALKQLQAIASFEDGVSAKLQDSLVREIASEFKDKFSKDAGMQGAAFDSACASISGQEAKNDPLTGHFTNALKAVDFTGKVKGKADGTVSERLAHLQEQQEAEFVRSFYVTDADAAEVKAAGSDETKLGSLMKKIYGKVGFHVPDAFEGQEKLEKVGSASGDKFVDEANAARDKALGEVRKKTLADFQASLA